MNVIRWISGFTQTKGESWREVLALEPVGLVIKKDGLRWFGCDAGGIK